MPWRDVRAKQCDRRYLQLMRDLLEMRIPYLRGGAERIEIIADRLGQAAGFDRQERAILRFGARYHNIGLLAIPDSILLAARALTADERAGVVCHVRLGGQLINLGYYDYPEVLETIWFHQERPDGKGPFALSGEAIPVFARITAVASAVDSMRTGRPYRAAMPDEAIVGELHDCAGSQFDSNVVRMFARIQREVFDSFETLAKRSSGAMQPSAGSRRRREPVGSATGAHSRAAGMASGVERAPAPRTINVGARLAGIQQMTPLPTAVSEVLMLQGNQASDGPELVRTVEQDVALAAKVLALANSLAYGPRRGRVATIEEAVLRLGFDIIKAMAAGIGALRVFGTEDAHRAPHTTLWEHCLATALIARELASHDRTANEGAWYLMGLLHDLGKFVLAEHFPDHVRELRQAESAAVERQLLETEHATIGATLLSGWNVPPDISRAVREHHRDWAIAGRVDLNEAGMPLALQVADALAVALGFGSGLLDQFPRIPAEVLGLCRGAAQLDVAALSRTVREQVREMKLLLGLFEAATPDSVDAECADAAEQPPISFVATERRSLDFLSVWLHYTRGRQVRTLSLARCEGEIRPESVVILDLPDAEPERGQIERVHALLNAYCGVVVAPAAWETAISGTNADWPVLVPPATTLSMEWALRQVSPDRVATP